MLLAAVRKASGLFAGMRVTVKVNRKGAQITLAPVKKSVSLKEIQSLLKYDGPAVDVSAMRVTDYKG